MSVSRRVRRILTEQLPSTTKIQVHYFTGTRQDLDKWRRTFPEVHFSLSGSVLGAVSKEQKAAIRAIPKDRLLLESDSPIQAKAGQGFSTPYLVGRIALAVAEILGQPHQGELLQQTLRNARRFFALDE